MFQVKLTRQAEKSFGQLMKSQPAIASRVAQAIDDLAKNPEAGVPLRGDLKGLFKYRVGVYRILYTVERKILLVTVIDIGHRKEVYR
jgi:mRNA interferase RelE/StbE